VSNADARETAGEDDADRCRILLRPNRSLTTKGMLALFGAFALIAAVIATGFALAGAWLVAPFAGLEVAVAGMVLHLLHRHAGDYERIDIEGRRVRVVQRRGKAEARHDFERYWAQVRLARGQGLRPSRLSIGSHGRFVEVGATLDEDARRELAQRLRRLLGPGFRAND
jgi:uncharacterized membrane protein